MTKASFQQPTNIDWTCQRQLSPSQLGVPELDSNPQPAHPSHSSLSSVIGFTPIRLLTRWILTLMDLHTNQSSSHNWSTTHPNHFNGHWPSRWIISNYAYGTWIFFFFFFCVIILATLPRTHIKNSRSTSITLLNHNSFNSKNACPWSRDPSTLSQLDPYGHIDPVSTCRSSDPLPPLRIHSILGNVASQCRL